MKTFEIVVPIGWVRLDLTTDVTGTVTALAFRLARRAPLDDRPRLVNYLREQLLGFARGLAEGGAVAVLMSTEPLDVLPTRPLIVMVPLTVPDGAEPMDMLMGVASSDPTAKVIDLEDLVALRVTSTNDISERFAEKYESEAPRLGISLDPPHETPAADTPDISMVSTRVRYLIGDPADRDRWVDVFFAIDHPDDPLVSELVDSTVGLFDAQVQTFRWTS